MNRYDLLDAFNRVDQQQIHAAEVFFENRKETHPIMKKKKLLRTLLIAAVIMALMSVTAYAAGLFNMNGRKTAEDEVFPVHFYTEEGDISGNWKGTYALKFDGPDVCQAVRCRFNWLPDRYSTVGKVDEEGWLNSFGWDGDPTKIPHGTHMELGVPGVYADFVIVDVYYAPQFDDGGALILLSSEPENITEETWDQLSVVRFQAPYRYSDWNADGEPEELTVTANFLVLFHPDEGWILTLRGVCPEEELLEIARNAEIEQTEEVVKSTDFQNPYAFFDPAKG